MHPAAISTRDLTRSFGPVVAVDRLNLEVHQGEIFGLVGPDGAGKSTALRLICGLLRSNSGQALVADFDVALQPAEVKASIGYMPQRFGLYADLTVEENVNFFARLRGVSRRDRDVFVPDLMTMTALGPFRSRQAGKLSGGMKQKLALMCTLLHRPKILVLDEPTNGLDPISRRDLWFLLYKLAKEGTTLLVSTSYLDEAARCHRVGLMDKGRLIQCDAPDRLSRVLAEDCYEVIGPDRRALQNALSACDGVVSVEPHGSAIHLLADPLQTSRESIMGELAAGSIAVTHFEQIVPSLEDVFIATVKRSGQNTANSV